MRVLVIAQLALLAVAGCVSVQEQPTPARSTVVTPAPVAPPGAVVVTRP